MKKGDTVRVIGGDETVDHVGDCGVVVGKRNASNVGGSVGDCFLVVRFPDGSQGHYWREELSDELQANLF
jgi:hypothetical protein